MYNKHFKYPDTKAYEFVTKRLKERGVNLRDLAVDAYDLQKEFIPELTVDECYESLITVLHKRELLNNAMVALELDRLAEAGAIAEPLQSIIENDAGYLGLMKLWPYKFLKFTARLAPPTSVTLIGLSPGSSSNLIPMKTMLIPLLMTF